MPKPPRVLAAGAVYHVSSDGDRQGPLFIDDTDRLAWVTLMREAREKFRARFVAYCLLPDCVHLVVRTQDPNLDRMMEWLKRSYARRFNARHAKRGRLFAGPYKAKLVAAPAWLPKLVRYLHRSPVAAGLVEDVSDWVWSSHPNYDGVKNDPLVETAPLERYSDFVRADIPKAEWKKLDSRRNGTLKERSGSTEFTVSEVEPLTTSAVPELATV